MADAEIHGAIEAVRAARHAVGAAEAKTKEAEALVAERNRELFERIRDGETTGDQALDFSIRRVEGFDPEVADLYRNLDAQVRAHAGEPVLVVFREIKYAGHTFGKGLTDPFAVESHGLGILSGGGLRFDQSGFFWAFPTETHAVHGARAGRAQASPLVIHDSLRSDLGSNLYTPLEGALDRQVSELVPKESGTMMHGFTFFNDRPILEIAVGEHDVRSLVADPDTGLGEEEYAKMLDTLLRLPIERGPGQNNG